MVSLSNACAEARPEQKVEGFKTLNTPVDNRSLNFKITPLARSALAGQALLRPLLPLTPAAFSFIKYD